ncbi:MAG TPA: sulfotransferase [Xanthomonadaceae bacterium]|nr:sulfotransferase [Xanthomonadaceae bacterium]
MAGTDVVARLQAGYQLLRASRHAEAIALAEDASTAFPADPRPRELAAEARLANGEPIAALRWIAAAAALSPSPLPLLLKQAELLVRLRQRDAAARVAAQAAGLAGGDGATWWRLGAIRSGCQDVAGAEQAYAQARVLLGDRPALLYDLATMHFFAGAFDAAEAVLDRLLELEPRAGDAFYLRSTLRRQTPERNHVDPLRRALAGGMEPAAAAACGYALAKELEDLGQHAEAFPVLAQAAARKRSTLRYDVGRECAAIREIGRAFTADALGTLRRGSGGDGALFIVGLPRTGTTLLERLLIERTGARSAGELGDFASLLGQAAGQQRLLDPGLTPAQAALRVDFEALGREYMRGAREAAGGHALFIDKMPVNYLYCGMIAAAMPKARILHLVRDPLDTAYAIYKTLFYGAYPFSYDLGELAEYYLAYRAAMAHWHAVLPGRILDVHYESLVAEPAGQVERVVQWCDLAQASPASDASQVPVLTASAAQVRGEVHRRSVHGSRRHLPGLAPLVARFREAGLSVDAPATAE